MATKTGRSVLRQLRRAALICADGGSDAELLAEFSARRDDDAFEALVRRHGPMVLGVCRRVVGHDADADDAFQATFLVLARKAGTLHNRDLLANWLYGVAYRTALEARSRMLRRRSVEVPFDDFPQSAAEPDADRAELLALLDREVSRLADRYRVPVVLCELEGRSRKEVAELLGIPEGTLSSRLAAARKLLADRLIRRGLAVSATAIGAALSSGDVSAYVPLPLLASTIEAAAGAACATADVTTLTHGVLKAMFLTKLKLSVVALAALGLGAGGVTMATFGSRPVAAMPADKDNEKPVKAPGKLDGAWKVESMVEGGKERPLPPEGAPHMFFTKDKIVLMIGERVEVIFNYKTNAAKKPAEIDLNVADGDKNMVAIYSVEGDTLKICFGEQGKTERPTAFEATDKSALMTLKRDPNAKMPDLKADGAKIATSAARQRSQNNIKQILLAMHNYASVYNVLPAAAIYDKDGKPLLSWRVSILPYIEQDALYKSFHLDEPWDSEHNKKLLAQMPKIYGPKGDKTHYRVFTGKSTAFEGKTGLKFSDFTDGTSNTMLVVEAVDPVEWTRPDEFEYSADKKLPKLGGTPFPNGFNVGMADGSVRFMSDKADEKLIRAVITRNGGEVIK